MLCQSEQLPYVVAICPTYRRPDCLQNAIACFEAQDYPAHRRYMLILDDSGELSPCSGDRWKLSVRKKRFDSLPQKYNWMASMVTGYADALFAWEDDEVFGPSHISSHVKAYRSAGAIGTAAWCKSQFVWSTHPDAQGNTPNLEPADGRFHSSLSLTREMFGAVNGWPLTDSLSFDQQFMSSMSQISAPLRPDFDPQFVFRWQDTGAYHGQGLGESFWELAEKVTKAQYRDHIEPKFDESTKALYKNLFGKEVS